MLLGREPDWVGLGVQRAGTTRMHRLITAHPDTEIVRDLSGKEVKEIHWFDEPLADDQPAEDLAYHAWFQAPTDKVVGEWTPRYLYDLWPIDRIASSCPSTKFVVLLRDPMDRLRSALSFYDQRGVTVDRDTVREAIWRGLYARQLTYLFERVDRHKVFIGTYEQTRLDTIGELRRLYAFLDLDPSFEPPSSLLEVRINAATPLAVPNSVLMPAWSLYEQDRAELEALLPDADFTHWS